jgi:hypothetical protein
MFSVNLETPIFVAVLYCGIKDQLPIWSCNFAEFLQEKHHYTVRNRIIIGSH